MPRKRRQPRRRRARVDVEALLAAIADGAPYEVGSYRRHPGGTADILRALVCGGGFFFACGHWSPEEEELGLEAWRAVKDELLAAHAQREGGRPWAWWHFEEGLEAEEASRARYARVE